MAIGLGGVLTGLGAFAQDYLKKRQADQQMEINRQYLQEREKLSQARRAAGSALSGVDDTGGGLSVEPPGGGFGGFGPASFGDQGGGDSGGFDLPQVGSRSMGIPTSRPMGQSRDMGGGMRSGSGLLESLVPQVAPQVLPPGYQTRITSADRPGSRVAGTGGVSQHALGNAIDLQILDPTGKAIPNKGEDTTGLYGKLAVGMRGALPEDQRSRLGWGGNFTTGPANGPRDLMHYDLAGDRGRFGTVAQLAAAAVNDPVMRPALQQSGQAAQRAAQITPQDAYGRMNIQSLARQIDKANPGLDPEIKFLALEQANKLLAPNDQKLWQLLMQQNSQQFQMMMEGYRQRNQEARDLRTDQRQEARDIRTEQRMQAREDRVDARSAERSRPGKVTALEVAQDDGSVKRVEAQQLPTGQWVSADEKREPIDVSKGYTVIPASQASAMGGSRDAAQRERQLIAGREVISDLQNIVKLPTSTTRGMFGGRTQGPGLFDALKENLAETMTDRDAQFANSALAGLERELSIIVSPVYGGKWAADSFSALKLKEGQPVEVKLFNLGRMRQIADNALEAMQTSPRIGREQKEYAKQMRSMLDEAVPWTSSDVLEFAQRGDNRETFGQFVKNKGVGKPGGAPAAVGRSMPIPQGLMNSEGKPATEGDGFTMKDGSQWMVRGGVLVPAPAGGEASQPMPSPVY